MTELGPQDFHALRAKLMEDDKSDHNMSKWKIVLLVLAVILGIVVIAITIYFCYKVKAPHLIGQRFRHIRNLLRERFSTQALPPEAIFQIQYSTDATPKIVRLPPSKPRDSLDPGEVARLAPGNPPHTLSVTTP